MRDINRKNLKKLCRLLWSANPNKVDFHKDRIYIIHQVLSWGEIEDLKLLFRIYGFDEVKKVFIKYPKKIYTFPSLKFVEIILRTKADESKYLSCVIDFTTRKE
ncbi:MAG: DUF6922 domain-containing protein [bacterium]